MLYSENKSQETFEIDDVFRMSLSWEKLSNQLINMSILNQSTSNIICDRSKGNLAWDSPQNEIYINNLPVDCTEDTLKYALRHHGEVQQIQLYL